MAHAGTTIKHALTGQRMTFVRTAADTRGALLQTESTIRGGTPLETLHIHPGQEERFTVLAGTMRFVVGGQERVAQAGQEVVVSAGTPHTFGNAGPDEARFRAEDRPALQSEGFFESYFGLAQDGKVNPRTGLPNLLQLAVALHHYRHEIVLVRPPRLVQRVLFGLLAPIGRLRGYRAPYPYPYRDRAAAASMASGP
jgi:mannose-6-phosphate isomerase-like protein (cupin superfamily)